jgi:hypothetical protein
VRISVPRNWRDRAAITWSSGPAATLRFEACAPPPTYLNGYVGGFFLSTRTACVPLIVQVGGRRATVLTGIARRC